MYRPDAVGQYTSRTFTEARTESGIAGSIGGVGDALDNAMREPTVGLYKVELIHRADCGPCGRKRRSGDGNRGVGALVNADRLHSSIGYRSPIDYETRSREPRPTAASGLEVA